MDENKIYSEEQEETPILTLTDENGVDVDFEYLDLIEYEGESYAVLLPLDPEDQELVILRVEETGGEEDNFVGVEDGAILEAIFQIVKEKFADEFDFEEV